MKHKTDPYYVKPPIAVQRMKKAHNIRQTVYIYGATGFGKTSFVKQYLTRRIHEYYTAAEIADIDLAKPLPSSRERIVVIDDLYLLDSAKKQEDAIPIIENLANNPDVWLILVSRSNIPGWLMNLHVLHIFVTITEEHLALGSKEIDQYFKLWDISLLTGTMTELKKRCQGYPLALRVCAIHLNELENTLQGEDRQLREFQILEQAQIDIFKYYESNVFAEWDDELQQFILQLSLVKDFTLEMARCITKKSNSGELLLRAMEIGNFLTSTQQADGTVVFSLREEIIGSCHKQLLQSYTEAQLTDLYRLCGNAYKMQGDIPNALEMYEKADDLPSIIEMLIENARIHPGAGRYWELRHYYLGLSDDYIRESPVMMAALSMVHSIMLNDSESERWYQELAQFQKEATVPAQRRLAKERLLYLDLGLPHRGSGQIVSIIKNAGTLFASEHVLPEISLTNNQPSILDGGKDFSDWVKHDKALELSIGKITEALLGDFGKGLVNLAMAESYFEKGNNDSEVYRRAIKGQMQAEAGGKNELFFIGASILSNMELLSGEGKNAIEMLDTMKTRVYADNAPLLRGIETLRLRYCLRYADTQAIDAWMKTAPNEDVEFCSLERYHYITKVKAYLVLGQRKKAMLLLNRLALYAEDRDRTHLLIEIKLLFAILHYRNGSKQWRTDLQEAITMAEEYHFVRVLSREGAPLYQMLREANIHFKDNSFRDMVLAECKQQAEYYPDYLAEIVTDTPLLSPKALRILRLQSEGLSVEQIAQEMGLSQAGIKYYNRETYKKLGVKGKAAAITAALNRKLI